MKQDDQAKIDEYLFGQLSPEERSAFERRLATDSDLADALMLQKETLALVELEGDERLRAKVRKVHLEQKKQGRPWVWYLLGALLFLLFAWGIYHFFGQTPTTNSEKLFAQHFQTYPLHLAERNTDEATDLLKAADYFQQNDFASAIPVLEQSLARDANPKTRLALGISLLGVQKIEEAQSHFRQLIESKDVLFYTSALWYNALAQLQQGDINACKNSLTKIAADTPFYAKARTLLADLP